MLFIVSDLHLGRQPDDDAENLGHLRTCIDNVSLESGPTDGLEVVFLGDVFDAYVDYDGYRPDALGRWLDLISDLHEQDIRTSYHAGNHDRWHRGTILSETGMKPLREPEVRDSPVGRILLTHGDREDDHGPLTGLIRQISGSTWAHRAYSLVLPARLGNGLAAAVSRRYAHVNAADRSVEALREAAFSHLAGDRADIVVFGHCHRAELCHHADGLYLNTGDWYRSRTFGVIQRSGVSEKTIRLMQFAGGRSLELDAAAGPVRRTAPTTKQAGLALGERKKGFTL